MFDFEHLKFPKKITLSGEDYFYLMLEANINKFQTGNNIVRVAFHFDEQFDLTPILNSIENSKLLYYINNLVLSKGNIFTKPHWKYVDLSKGIKVKRFNSPIEIEIPEEILNKNMDVYSNELIEFDVVCFPSGKKALVFSWHHILFDGKGASLLLDFVTDNKEVNLKNIEQIFPKKHKESNIFKQIVNLYQVKRFIEKNNKKTTSTFVRTNVKNEKFINDLLVFTIDESQKIKENAFKKGAKFGANTYILGACIYTVASICKKKNIAGDFWIPVPYDGRKRGSNGPIIGNTISFVFYKIDEKDLDSLEKIIRSLTNQMKEQLNQNIHKRFSLLLSTMRFFPLRLYRFLVNSSSSKHLATFLYSSSGENNWEMNQIAALPFIDIQLIQPYTFPPGLTFSVSQNDSAIKINLSFVRSVLTDEEEIFLKRHLKSLLLSEF